MGKVPGLHRRRNLPHLLGVEGYQFLTFREVGTLPAHVLGQIDADLKSHPIQHRISAKSRRINEYLDLEAGPGLLSNSLCARIIQTEIVAGHPQRYRLLAWVVMPNHVHVLLRPKTGAALSEIVRLIKGRSANAINKALGRSGKVWQEDYFDKFIPDEPRDLEGVRHYIEWNPVKAKLCVDPQAWAFSSALPIHREQIGWIDEP